MMYHICQCICVFLVSISSKQVTGHTSFEANHKHKEWVSLEKLKGESEVGVGYSVASSRDGKIVAYSSPYKNNNEGRVEVHEFDVHKGWVQMGYGVSGSSINEYFGHDIALTYNGKILAVSAPRGANGKGYVGVYSFDGPTNSWNQIGENIEGENFNEELGYSIAINQIGNFVALGAPNLDTEPGSVRVYQYDGDATNSGWKKVGPDIRGETPGDENGHAVDILEHKGDIYVGVGAPKDLKREGSATVFKYNRGTNMWEQLGNRYVDGNVVDTNLGSAVSLAHDGKYLLFGVGFPGAGVNENSSIKSGVEVYSIDDEGNWDYYSPIIFPKEANDDTGFKLSLSEDGQTLAISSPLYGQRQGLVRVYNYNNDEGKRQYEEIGTDIVGDDSDILGWSLALSRDGKVVVAGSPDGKYVATYERYGPKAKGMGTAALFVLFKLAVAGVVLAGIVIFSNISFKRCRERGQRELIRNNVHEDGGNSQTVGFPVRQEIQNGNDLEFESNDVELRQIS